MEIDDKSLTLFLMGCMTETFQRTIKATDLHMVPGTIQRGLKKDGLKYLEIIAGTAQRSRVDIFVYADGTRSPIFAMNIVSTLDSDEIGRLHLNFFDVLRALQEVRLAGFEQTRINISKNKKYSLFDIPAHKQPAPVGKGGHSGSFHYSESVENELDFFGGGEEIFFLPDASGKSKSLVFRSQIQGCRL